tara:strand:- start:1708 stop:2418 length:711 start_codon:yes stop_codon:yes gene_type:complete
MSKHYSSGKTHNLYDLYADSEKTHKTNWGENTTEEQLEYLKRLEAEGFRAVPEGLMMEESLDGWKRRYDEDINRQSEKGSSEPIPVIPPTKEHRAPQKNPEQKKNINIKRPKPEVMSKEEKKTKFTLSNIISYVKAEQSLATQGPVSLTVYEERKKICGECPHRKTNEKVPDPLGFCTKCGCGANPRARLTNKIKMPQTSCPLDKWGTSTGIYKGILGKLRHKLTPKSKREKLDYT